MIKVKFVDFPKCSIPDITLEILREKFGEVIECDDPDFLFYSAFGYEHLKYDCVRICWLGENLQPDFNICDYSIGFSYMDFEDRYCRIPLYYFYLEDYKKAIKKHLISETDIAEKQKFCNFVYSNSDADSRREEFYDLLSQYKTIDSGGRFRNNIGGPVPDKFEFQKKYKFSIAFENSSTSGYTTEKILQAFSAGTIPIYWGNPNVERDFNEKAFINCHKYDSFKAVIDEIRRIDEDEKLFEKYLSEPIGTKEQFPDDPLKKYKEYIVHIFEQSPEKAFRRNNVFWGADYQNRMRKLRFPTKLSFKERCIRKAKKLLKRILIMSFWKI